jgi:hypothetical protein
MTQESNKFPVKTTIGVGIFLLLFWRGKGFGLGSGGMGFKGEGEGEENKTPKLPDELQKLLLTEPSGTRLTGTVQLVTVQRGKNFTGKDTPQDFVFAKNPGNGEAISMTELVGLGGWFKKGQLNLVVRISGTILHGNLLLIQKKLAEAGIPVVYQKPIVTAGKPGFVWG